jgi:GAF domain-containing protein
MAEIRKMRIPDIAILKWQNIADLLAEVAGAPAATINMLEGDFVRVIGSSTNAANTIKKGEEIPISTGSKVYCVAVIQARERLIIPNATKSDFWKDSEGAKAGFIAYAGMPIFQPDGDIFGSLCLFDTKENSFSGPVMRLMEEFAEIVTGHLSLISKNTQLEDALKEVRTLQGLIPICANCKKIRDDKGFWQKVEVYLEERSNARFTHGLCEDCIHKLYGKEKWFKEKDK